MRLKEYSDINLYNACTVVPYVAVKHIPAMQMFLKVSVYSRKRAIGQLVVFLLQWMGDFKAYKK